MLGKKSSDTGSGVFANMKQPSYAKKLILNTPYGLYLSDIIKRKLFTFTFESLGLLWYKLTIDSFTHC